MSQNDNVTITNQIQADKFDKESYQIPTSAQYAKQSIFRLLFFVLVAFLGFFFDIVTKNWAFSLLGLPGDYRQIATDGIYWLLPDVFGFQTSLNGGGLFGMWQGQAFPLAILSCLALFGICLWVFFEMRRSWFMTFALGIISAGILGNLYDRLGFHLLLSNDGNNIYAVRDWILVMIGSYHWPNFNLADTFLVCGTILILLQPLFEWITKKFFCNEKSMIE
ncbi:MAG: signal peptidase II [Planctomycetaceae bacterium]|nr:signal peptidase II [Planctomycetaceae bacterium]